MYLINPRYTLEKLNNDLVAINFDKEKFIILEEVEQFILDNIVKMSENDLVEIAKSEYSNSETIEEDIHDFICSLIEEEIIISCDNDDGTD